MKQKRKKYECVTELLRKRGAEREGKPDKELTDKILLPEINYERAADEIGQFVINTLEKSGHTGCVIGLSGGVDSTTTAAIISKAFHNYNRNLSRDDRGLQLIGYILPSKSNEQADTNDGIAVAQKLGIKYEIHSIEKIVEAYENTNPEALDKKFHRGNLTSRIRANVLNTKAATEEKIVAGTGNRDEDYGIGYYTLFGDGAVHISPIGNLSKRLVRGIAKYFGFEELADRVPTAGLEPGQTDFKDLGYRYDLVELVTEGLDQGFTPEQLSKHKQVAPLVEEQFAEYEKMYGEPKFIEPRIIILDIINRHKVAKAKEQIISPPIAPVTLHYK